MYSINFTDKADTDDDDELHVAFKVCNTDSEEGLTWAEVEKCEVFEQNSYKKQFLFYNKTQKSRKAAPFS